MEIPKAPINITKFFDNYNLPVQADGDGGDTANRFGLLSAAAGLLKREVSFKLPDGSLIKLDADDYFSAGFGSLEIAPGILARHPEQWNEAEDFSRDQQTPVVIAAGMTKAYDELQSLAIAHLKRFGKYQNKDWASPEHIAIYTRAFINDDNVLLLAPLAYPSLLLGDIFTFFNSIARVYASYKNPDDTSDDVNHILVMIQQRITVATPISWLARQVYVHFRKNAGKDKDSRLSGLAAQSAYDHYFREETGAPPMNDIYRPLIKEYLSN
jgi:hypothetical protein